MADDGFQEIQLTGKQVVFLFMATTVIAAGIFLSGVLVGRGVRAERATAGGQAALLSAPQEVPDGTTAPAPAAQADPAPAPPPTDELSYYQRLQGESAPAETLGSDKDAAGASSRTPTPANEQVPSAPAQQAGPPAAAEAVKAPGPPAAEARGAPATTTASRPQGQPAAGSGEPAGDGFVVQVASVRERAEADAILKHLQAKGYSAFVLPPGPGSPVSTFRVRVGKFKARREAEKTAQRLEKEEQYKPWVTR
jgi:cell division septation protein DedD